MCLFILLLLVATIFIMWTLWGSGDQPDRFRLRLPAIAGSVMVFTSFLFMPWIKFAPIDYLINILPDLIEDDVTNALAFLIKLLGQVRVAKLVTLITSIGYLPGWALIILMPTKSIMVRLTIFLVGLVGLVGLLWFPISLFIHKQTVFRTVSIVQAIISFLVALLLLFQTPMIEAWGSSGTFFPGLITLFSGVQMGFGVWVAWVGLLLLGLGNLFQIHIADESVVSENDDDWSKFRTRNL